MPSKSICAGLRCEWAKSKARADRWREEILLLTEEMRRVITFLDWKAGWWSGQASTRAGLPKDIADGTAGYTGKQAHIHQSLAQAFARTWHPLLTSNGLSIEWPLSYIPTVQVADQQVHDDNDICVDAVVT